jgi:hypothetical protein
MDLVSKSIIMCIKSAHRQREQVTKGVIIQTGTGIST